MRKFLTGIIVGALLMFGGTAFADELQSLVGQQVQGLFPVEVEGEELDSPAIVVDGRTYLPVRSFGEAIGYEVLFDAEGGVRMERETPIQQSVIPREVEPEPEPEPHPDAELHEEWFGRELTTIEDVESRIEIIEDLIERSEIRIRLGEQVEQAKESLEQRQEQLEYLYQLKAEFEASQ